MVFQFLVSYLYRIMNKERLWILLAKKMNGELSAEELEELNSLVSPQAEDLSFKVDLIEHLWQTGAVTKTDDELAGRLWDKISNSIEEKQPVLKKRWLHYVAIAAVFLTVCITGWVLIKNDKPEGINQVSTNSKSHSKILLPDGTIVWLNSNSHLTYNEGFGKTKREITLIGEAFFDVAHNAGIPLHVFAKSVNIKVKGTAFNVMAYPEDDNVETSLISGVVELSVVEDPSRKILLRPNEKLTVRVNKETDSAGLQPATLKIPFSDSFSNLIKTTHIDLYKIKALEQESSSNMIPEISWIENKLVFNSEPLEEVARKMERWYDATITIEDEALKSRKFTGVFYKENLTQAIKALQLTYQFRYTINGNKVLINNKN